MKHSRRSEKVAFFLNPRESYAIASSASPIIMLPGQGTLQRSDRGEALANLYKILLLERILPELFRTETLNKWYLDHDESGGTLLKIKFVKPLSGKREGMGTGQSV